MRPYRDALLLMALLLALSIPQCHASKLHKLFKAAAIKAMRESSGDEQLFNTGCSYYYMKGRDDDAPYGSERKMMVLCPELTMGPEQRDDKERMLLKDVQAFVGLILNGTRIKDREPMTK